MALKTKTYNNVQANVTFSKAGSRVEINPTAGEAATENIALTLGKISKWYEALVPTGGSSGKILAWNSSGTAKWNDPLHPSITKSADTTSTPAQLAHGGTFTAITTATRDSNGHVTTLNTATYKLPAQYTHPTYIDKTTADFYKIKITNGHISEATAIASADVSTFLNLLGTGSSTPVDNDYYISQYVNGGTTTTSYHRRPMSALWLYIKGKADNEYAPKSHNHAYTVPAGIVVKTGSSDQSHITLQTLMTWLITTKGYITSNTARSLTLYTSWSYAGNDILQLTINGTAYELQLAGVIIEFDGYASDYQTGMFRLRIHSSPTVSFTPASGYTQFPASHIAEYTCNGSSYSPTWKMLVDIGDKATTSAYGITKLYNGVDSTSTTLAATANAVKTAYDKGNHSHPYLPTAGGTMTGDITFTGISPSSYPTASKGIKWSGGTDAIDMYYNLRASDAGELIINMRDDTNVRTSFAYNGTVVSYIDTSGVYNGTASVATKLGTANKGSATKGIYLSGGTPQEMTYELKSTVNGGTAGRLAYYSGANTISKTEGTSPTGGLAFYEADSSATTPARRTMMHVWGQTYGNKYPSDATTNTASNMISNTPGVFTYGDGGPQITFSTAAAIGTSGAQEGALIYTDHDAAATGVSWHFVSNQGDWNVTSKRFHARTSISIGTDLPNTSYNLYVNGTTNITGNTTIGGTLSATGAIKQNGNQVLHAGNYTSYAYPLSIAADSGTNQLTMYANTKYKITAGGSAYIFTAPPNANYLSNQRDVGITYGANKLEWYDLSANNGTDVTKKQNPTNDWYHHITMHHGNSNGYFVDIAACFHSNNIYYRRVANGADASGGWIRLIDSSNIGYITLDATTVNTTAGSFVFGGNALLGGVNDWAGIQVEGINDRFQLLINGHLMVRQNDDATISAAGWTAWTSCLRPADVSGSGGITVTQNDVTVGSGSTAATYKGTITLSHTNSITAGTAKGDNSKTLTFGGTFKIPSITYDANGHITTWTTTTMTMPTNPNTNTTYTLGTSTDTSVTPSEDTVTLTPSSGSVQTIKVPYAKRAKYVYTDSIGSGAASHAAALQTYFNANKDSINRNSVLGYYSSAESNGSICMGYFLNGYNDTPYGGFFVAHYNTPKYVGISNGTFTQHILLSNQNYTDYTVKKDGTGATGTWGINITGNASTATNASNVYGTVTNGTTTTTRYGVVFAADPNTSEYNTMRKTYDFRINLTNGSTNTTGLAELVLGNATAKNTADNKQGSLTLYSAGTSYHQIFAAETNSAINHTLPATTGTILNTGTTSWTQTVASSATGAYQIGKIKINGTETVVYGVNTDTNTKVTSSANHYTPSTASGQDKTASASGATAAWSIDVVKGITINTDGKGHVTGLSVTSGKIPANPNTNTTYTLGVSGDNVTLTPSSGSVQSITVPYATSSKEAYLRWGGRDFVNDCSPVDQAMVASLSPNRLELTRAAGITIERSANTGSSWSAVTMTDGEKRMMTSIAGPSMKVTATDTRGMNANAAKYLLRITLDASSGVIYSLVNKFVTKISTSGSSGCYVKIYRRTVENAASGTDTWQVWNKTSKSWVATTDSSATDANTKNYLDGWFGFNVINFTEFKIGTTANAGQYRNVRFVFGAEANNNPADSSHSADTYGGMIVYNVLMYGGWGWGSPSNLANTGHLYSWDGDEKATFPAEIKVPTQMRIFAGSYGMIIRNDNTNTYFLPTAANDPQGSWRSPDSSYQFPLYINNSSGKVTMGNNVEIVGSLILSKTQDAVLGQNKYPALIVGGAPTDPHLELDGNEIMAKSNGTTGASLYLNSENGAGYVFINDGYAGHFTATPTSGQIVVTDGTTGGIKSSGYSTSSFLSSSTKYAASASVGGPASSVATAEASANANRVVFFADNSDTKKLVYDNDFKYNPSTNELTAQKFKGSLLRYHPSADLSTAGTDTTVSVTEYPSYTFSYVQTPAIFGGTDGRMGDSSGNWWAHYAVMSHGSGNSQYRYILRFPFWGAPQYQRPTATSSNERWRNFLTDETGAGGNYFLAYPADGYYYSPGNATGAIDITLPVGPGMMLSFSVDIWDYSAGKSCTYKIAGYGYATDNKWYSTTAYCIGKPTHSMNIPVASSVGQTEITNLNVRFGYNSTSGKLKVQIGETDTSWSYLGVQIHDVTFCYGTTYFSTISKGWSIGIVTSNIPNVSSTVKATNIAYHASAIALTHGNECNFTGPSSGTTNIWFGYRKADVNGTETSTAYISRYLFGNGNNTAVAGITCGDIIINTATSGAPTLSFIRGTTSDNYYDWRIKDQSGALWFDVNISGTWTSRGWFPADDQQLTILGSVALKNGSYEAKISPSSMTANRTFTLPNKSGGLPVSNILYENSTGTQAPTVAEAKGYKYFIVTVYHGTLGEQTAMITPNQTITDHCYFTWSHIDDSQAASLRLGGAHIKVEPSSSTNSITFTVYVSEHHLVVAGNSTTITNTTTSGTPVIKKIIGFM